MDRHFYDNIIVNGALINILNGTQALYIAILSDGYVDDRNEIGEDFVNRIESYYGISTKIQERTIEILMGKNIIQKAQSRYFLNEDAIGELVMGFGNE